MIRTRTAQTGFSKGPKLTDSAAAAEGFSVFYRNKTRSAYLVNRRRRRPRRPGPGPRRRTEEGEKSQSRWSGVCGCGVEGGISLSSISLCSLASVVGFFFFSSSFGGLLSKRDWKEIQCRSHSGRSSVGICCSTARARRRSVLLCLPGARSAAAVTQTELPGVHSVQLHCDV